MQTTILLVGVFEDGTTVRDPLVPENPRQSLAFPQSETVRVIVRVTNPAGVPVPPDGTPVLTVKKRPQDFPPLASLTGTWDSSLGSGVIRFDVASTTFRGVEFGRYVYDVVITGALGERATVIPSSPLTLLAAVSAAP
jgi:hypothetical protein